MTVHVPPPEHATPVKRRAVPAEDRAIARRLRAIRKAKGAPQSRLAEAAGVTVQQIQHYENGRDRIAAGRLLIFARALDVPVACLFEDAAPGERAERAS